VTHEVVWGRATHHFMEQPENGYVTGNQCSGTLKVTRNSLKGYYQTCADGRGYLEWRLRRVGFVVFTRGASYGFIKSRPHIGYTHGLFGFWLFGWMLIFGKAFNFAKTKTGKRSWGVMMLRMKVQKTNDTEPVPLVEALRLTEPPVVDPHLKK